VVRTGLMADRLDRAHLCVVSQDGGRAIFGPPAGLQGVGTLRNA